MTIHIPDSETTSPDTLNAGHASEQDKRILGFVAGAADHDAQLTDQKDSEKPINLAELENEFHTFMRELSIVDNHRYEQAVALFTYEYAKKPIGSNRAGAIQKVMEVFATDTTSQRDEVA